MRPVAALPPPALPLHRRIGEQTLKATFHLLRPHVREAFCVARPSRLPAWWWQSADGWRGPLYRLDPRPGGSGEPILLMHGLGGSAADFLLTAPGGTSLAAHLSAAGYTVLLMEHRGDRSALPPKGAAPWSLDTVVMQDLDAAITLIREQLGFSRILWLGHGLGAQSAGWARGVAGGIAGGGGAGGVSP